MNVSIPKTMDEKNITIDEAVSLIKKKGETPKKRKESK